MEAEKEPENPKFRETQREKNNDLIREINRFLERIKEDTEGIRRRINELKLKKEV